MANSFPLFYKIVSLVVNCFQISNFVLWQTAFWTFFCISGLLWIAFKLVILSYGKQRFVICLIRYLVVNCFQISNFVLWQTALYFFFSLFVLLWIAFKLVILSYGKQLVYILIYLFIVVNCFQISNFVLWQTAVCLFYYINLLLWIAFKLVILSYGKQLINIFI